MVWPHKTKQLGGVSLARPTFGYATVLNDADIINFITTIEILYEEHLNSCVWSVCPLLKISLLSCSMYGRTLLCPAYAVEGCMPEEF